MECKLNMINNVSKLEAVLFASGEPITIDRLALTLELSVVEINALITQLNNRYDKEDSALVCLRLGDKLQLSTREEFAQIIKIALDMRRNTPLSSAAFEVLAIIAYNEPVSKSFVEQVRGVDSSSVVNTLVEKGLVEEIGRLDIPGRPIAYKTTPNFLRCFGVSSLKGLPPLPRDEIDNEQQTLFDDDEIDILEYNGNVNE